MDARQVFVRVVDEGSFTAAGHALGLSTSYVSRCVRQLEGELGVALLARSTRSVQPTEAGRVYHSRLAPLFQGLVEADLEVSARQVTPRGVLRVAMPHAFGRRWVLPTLVAFQQRWPEVHAEVQFSDRQTDPLAVDLTIRGGGGLADSGLVARRLIEFEDLLVASPSFLAAHGPIRAPSDLEGMPAVLYTGHHRPNRWTLTCDDQTHTPDVQPVMRSDSGEAVVEAAMGGLGVALQPEFLAGPAIADGRLVHLLPEWHARKGAFWAVTASRLLPATVRAFIDELADVVEGRPWLP